MLPSKSIGRLVLGAAVSCLLTVPGHAEDILIGGRDRPDRRPRAL